MARYVLLSCVLDQGPDIQGVRMLLPEVVERLYQAEVPFLHHPHKFFDAFPVVFDAIRESHELVRGARAREWATENDSNEGRYSLFFTGSTRGIVASSALDYIVHRWGVPLTMIRLVEGQSPDAPDSLIKHLESFPSAHRMALALKTDEKWGFGGAIGNKATNLFAKMFVETFGLTTKISPGWDGLSYESPLDSNAGRVLLRSGFLSSIMTIEDLVRAKAVQAGSGKGGQHYFRVTNMRGIWTSVGDNPEMLGAYQEISKNHLQLRSIHRRIPMAHVPNVLSHALAAHGTQTSLAAFDDGLIHVGTKFCYNNANPNCRECPLKNNCHGFRSERDLITKYRT